MPSKSNNISTERKTKFRSMLLRNNLVACKAHALILVLLALWYFIFFSLVASFIQNQTTEIVLIIVFIVLPLIAAYIYSGYRYMHALPKLNFLSTLAPMAIFLLSNSLALIELPALLAGTSCLVAENFPLSTFAFVVNVSGYSIVMPFFLGIPDVMDNVLIQASVKFVAAFIPSLLMYLGLRIRISQDRKKYTEARDEEDVHDN